MCHSCYITGVLGIEACSWKEKTEEFLSYSVLSTPYTFYEQTPQKNMSALLTAQPGTAVRDAISQFNYIIGGEFSGRIITSTVMVQSADCTVTFLTTCRHAWASGSV